MDLSQPEKALLPYEKKLSAQERLRRILGVKEVERPTYERYITGPIERFDHRKNAFMALMPDNPFGEEIRDRFKKRTGYDSRLPLPHSELEDSEARIGQALASAAWRVCREYDPKTLPATPPKGRIEVTDKARITRLVKKIALFFGAQAARVTRVDERWLYKGVHIPHPYVILVVVSHGLDALKTAPSHFSSADTAETYSRVKFITTQLADFIRGLGYDAAYRETLGQKNPEMLIVPTAIDAGIGEFGRNGRVLSPEFGINMRIKAVTTDLPLQVDKPISFGVHEFCTACESCAAYCPVNAISFGPPSDAPFDIYNNPGFRKWYVHGERCITFWSQNKQKWGSCSRCISVCPWVKPNVSFHNVVRWMAIHSSRIVKKRLVWADRVMYHRRKKTGKD
jgi:reductive dehalogenase